MKCFECGEELDLTKEGAKWELCPEHFEQAISGGLLTISPDNLVRIYKERLNLHREGVLGVETWGIHLDNDLFKALFGKGNKEEPYPPYIRKSIIYDDVEFFTLELEKQNVEIKGEKK